MDTGLLALIQTVGAVLVAAIVAVIVGRRRGIDAIDQRTDKAEARGDTALQRTLDAQDHRIELQDREIAEMRVQVTKLQEQVASLTADLHASDAVVRRLTVALNAATVRGEATT